MKNIINNKFLLYFEIFGAIISIAKKEVEL